MKKLDERPPAIELTPASLPDPQPARRLIVLVPQAGVDSALTARKIWELANALDGRVQFLGLSSDAAHEPGLRRQLVTLSAIVAGGNILVDTKIEIGNSWLNAVKSEWREGDVIICFEEHRLGIIRRTLSQVLESKLKATVYVITGMPQTDEQPRRNWAVNTIAWAGSILIILAFFGLQIKLTQFPGQWTQTALLYISLFTEGASIWAWNNLFG